MALRPTRAQVVRPERAGLVVGPAYDALRPEERRRLAAAEPDSFFNVVRSPGEDEDDDPDASLDAAAAALARLLEDGAYGPPEETLYLYRLVSEDHAQVAVVGDVPTAAVADGSVRPHEKTRTAKEAELARHLRRLRMNSSPVGLAHLPSPAVDEVVAAEVRRPPMLEFTSSDGVAQAAWALGPVAVAALVEAFAEVGSAYIVDGHHRVAAALQVGDPAFLAALVPTDQLHLLPYHRLVSPPLAVSAAELVRRVDAVPSRHDGDVAPPSRPGAVLLRAAERWWRFDLDVGGGRRLDVVALEEDVLAPVLGIIDPRRDPRLDVVPGHHDLARLAELADRRGGAAFALHPPTVDQLVAEADAGRTLPPKSTWFEPKLRSGVFVVRR